MAEESAAQTEGNTSGQGQEAVLPDELKGLNWGACFLNFIWGLYHRSYLSLLVLIPVVNVVMLFVLLFKGNQWAWANKTWDDVDHFRRVQRQWARAALILVVFGLTAGSGGFYWLMTTVHKSSPFLMAVERVRQNPVARKNLGEPINPGWFVSGDFKITGPKGNADFAVSLAGPKGEGKVYVSAVMNAGKWKLGQVFLDIAATGKRFNLSETEKKAAPAFPPDYLKGIEAAKKGDFATALKLLQPLADKGYANAQYNMGVLYKNGLGVAKDLKKAADWYRRASEQGERGALNNLGLMYQKGDGVPQNHQEAFKLYSLSANQGFPLGQRNLGAMYSGGMGVEKNAVFAYQWLSLAAAQGDEGAKPFLEHLEKTMAPDEIDEARSLAKRWKATPPKKMLLPDPANFERGMAAVKRGDFKAALKDLKPLAAQGHAEAQYNLAILYDFGRGVSKNPLDAEKYYKLAAEQGLAAAQTDLAVLYAAGDRLPLSYRKAAKWARLAAEQGEVRAIKTLGDLYAGGLGVTRDNVAAHVWWTRASAKGDRDAEKNIYKLEDKMTEEEVVESYRIGAAAGSGDVIRDKADKIVGPSKVALQAVAKLTGAQGWTKSLPKLKLMASKNKPEAQVLLGDLHLKGVAVYQSPSMALTLYQPAAMKGYAEAQFKLGVLYQEGLGAPIYPEEGEKWLKRAAEQGYQKARLRLEAQGIEPPPVKKKMKSDKKGKMAKAKKTFQPGFEIKLEGTGPVFATVFPKVEVLIKRYAAAVNDDDVDALKALLQPEYAACAKKSTQAIYDNFLAQGLGFRIPEDYDLSMGPFEIQGSLPFLDMVSYPVPPTHYVRLNFKDEPKQTGPGTIDYATAIIQPIVFRANKWSLVFGCPTAEGLERLRRAGLGGKNG